MLALLAQLAIGPDKPVLALRPQAVQSNTDKRRQPPKGDVDQRVNRLCFRGILPLFAIRGSRSPPAIADRDEQVVAEGHATKNMFATGMSVGSSHFSPSCFLLVVMPCRRLGTADRTRVAAEAEEEAFAEAETAKKLHIFRVVSLRLPVLSVRENGKDIAAAIRTDGHAHAVAKTSKRRGRFRLPCRARLCFQSAAPCRREGADHPVQRRQIMISTYVYPFNPGKPAIVAGPISRSVALAESMKSSLPSGRGFPRRDWPAASCP